MNRTFTNHPVPPPSVNRYKRPCFKGLLLRRFNNTCGWNKKIRSDVIYGGQDLQDGELLETRTRMYSIVTGGIIEEDGIKYYEIYPELYNYEQASIIDAALQMMRKCNNETKLKYAS